MEKLNTEVKKHIEKYLKSKDWPVDDAEYYSEVIRYGKEVYSEIIGEHRWYEDELRVITLDGKHIGFSDYHMTGDACASDMDLEFDWSSVQFYEPHVVTVTKYKPVD